MSANAIDAAVERARQEMAKRLLRAAIEVWRYHTNKVSVPVVKVGGRVTVRSKPGEYPRLDTAHGKQGVVYGPTTLGEVIAAGLRVRIGQTQPTWYMVHLEADRDRLGFTQTANTMRPLVQTLLTGRAP